MAKTNVKDKSKSAAPAKGAKTEDKKTTATASGKPKVEEVKKKTAPAFSREMDMKYGISDLASAMDLDETYTRAKLRQHGVEKKAKGGTAYGWNSRGDLDEVVKKLKAGAPAKKDAKAVKTTAKTDKKTVPAKKAASIENKPTGMPAGGGKGKATVPITKDSPHAPKDGAIKKVAAEVKKDTAKLNKK